MAFRITLTDGEGAMPRELSNLNIDLYTYAVHTQEHRDSRLAFGGSHQFYLALTPFTMYGKTFSFRTFKGPYTKAQFEDFLNHLTESIAYRKREYQVHHYIEIYNTYGAWDSAELYAMLDEKYPSSKVINAACTLNANHKIRIIEIENNLYVFSSPINPGVILKIISALPLLIESLRPDKISKDINPAYPTELLTALGDLDYDKWVRYYRTWWDGMQEIRDRMQMLSTCDKLGNGFLQNKLREIDRQIENKRSSIQSYYEEIRRYEDSIVLTQKQRMQLEIFENPIIEFTDYLKKIRCIKRIEEFGIGYLGFHVLQPMNIFDAEGATKYIHAARENYFNRKLKPLFIDVMVDQTYELWFYTCFKIDFNNGSFSSYLSRFTPIKGVPDPHLTGGGNAYNCWGNNDSYIRRAYKSSDFIVMFEQMLAACRAFNVHDSSVVNYFENRMTGHDMSLYYKPKCIRHIETDTWYTIDEYLKMKQKEKEEKEMAQKNATDNTGTI